LIMETLFILLDLMVFFLPGIPIGKVEVINGIKNVKFFSDLTQLDFVKIRYIKRGQN